MNGRKDGGLVVEEVGVIGMGGVDDVTASGWLRGGAGG